MNADGSGKTRLTAGYEPHWSPDGKRIVFTRFLGPPKYDVILVMNADGSDVKLVTQRQAGQARPSWTADGGSVLFIDGSDDVCVVNLDGSGRAKLTQTKGKIPGDVAVSPDGRSRTPSPPTRTWPVEVARLSGKGAPVKVIERLWDYVAGSGGLTLAWTPDGKAISVANSTGSGTAGSPIVVVKADGSGLSAVPGIDSAIRPRLAAGVVGSRRRTSPRESSDSGEDGAATDRSRWAKSYGPGSSGAPMEQPSGRRTSRSGERSTHVGKGLGP